MREARAFKDGFFCRDIRLCKDSARPQGGFSLAYWQERRRGYEAFWNVAREATKGDAA